MLLVQVSTLVNLHGQRPMTRQLACREIQMDASWVPRLRIEPEHLTGVEAVRLKLPTLLK